MIVTGIKTHKITPEDSDICTILDQYLPELSERSIVVVTSKIVSITEGRIIAIGSVDKDELIQREAQYYLPRDTNKYHVSFTITNNTLVPTAGIDESNGNGYYILWPKDPQETANRIREHVQKKHGIKQVGVIITDSKTTPLRWGVTAIAIAYSGFDPLKSYIGKPDIFGKNLEYTKMSIMDNLASAAAMVMGEGSEQRPLAVITEIPGITFQDRHPTAEEIAALRISLDEDLYAPFLQSIDWKKGKASEK